MLKIRKLICEYIENTIGIYEQKHRLSLILDSEEKNIFQTVKFCQILSTTFPLKFPIKAPLNGCQSGRAELLNEVKSKRKPLAPHGHEILS